MSLISFCLDGWEIGDMLGKRNQDAKSRATRLIEDHILAEGHPGSPPGNAGVHHLIEVENCSGQTLTSGRKQGRHRETKPTSRQYAPPDDGHHSSPCFPKASSLQTYAVRLSEPLPFSSYHRFISSTVVPGSSNPALTKHSNMPTFHKHSQTPINTPKTALFQRKHAASRCAQGRTQTHRKAYCGTQNVTFYVIPEGIKREALRPPAQG